MELFILCVKIFFVRILDVSLGTVRMIITVKGNKLVASLIGFFEILVWFLIVKEALNTTETSIFIALSYSLGYATGTYIGGILSDKFVSGTLSVQVVLSNNNHKIVDKIREEGFAVSVVNVKGKEDHDKYMLFMEIDKKKINQLKYLIKSLDSKAFVVVNETKMVENGFFK
ncbi:MAG: DUF5698 domain-containing protein [Firmicutes bacterium]|nr:DUF5698 domain-containing protein [Bacillota bacterium]